MTGRKAMGVLIVDDSAVYRQILEKILQGISEARVVGCACDGRDALDFVERHRPEVVLLDVEMPGMDGLEVLERLRRDFPDVAVLMVSGVADARRTMKALSLGALDFIVKPEDGEGQALRESLTRALGSIAHRVGCPSEESREPLAALATRVSTRSPAPDEVAERVVQGPQSLVVLGISTGGPVALERVIPALPGDLASPVLIVQHMPAGFTASLAESLDGKSALSVAEAKDGDSVVPGRVLIAPGGRHMELARSVSPGESPRIHLHRGPLRNECRPSVDVLFHSVAKNFAGRVLAVVLTGMGRDGVDGLSRIRERGALCVAQEQSTCVVYGMPRAVIDAGLADEVLGLEGIAHQIASFDGESRGELET